MDLGDPLNFSPSTEGGLESPYPSSPSTDSLADDPYKRNSPAPYDRSGPGAVHLSPRHLTPPIALTLSPVLRAPPNSALTTPGVKTPSSPEASSRESSPPGSSYGHPYAYGEKEGDFWSSIQKHYDELMDDGLIEKCKDVESDFSLDEESESPPTFSVSFTEFLEQYKELSAWLQRMKSISLQTVHSQSEKYMNQTYHEEMMERSPRRKLFKEYARQLLRRFPNLKDEICTRLGLLNRQWKELELQISGGPTADDTLEMSFVDDASRSPSFTKDCRRGSHSFSSMSTDLEEDLVMLQKWLTSVESRLGPLTLRKVKEMSDLEEKLKEYQSIQSEIESQARVISAVFKLCDRLDSSHENTSPQLAIEDPAAEAEWKIERKDSLRQTATVLQKRWHEVWLLALEWQCCLEERLSKKVVSNFCLSPFLDKKRAFPSGWCKMDLSSIFQKEAIDPPNTSEVKSVASNEPEHDAGVQAGAAAVQMASVSTGTENVCRCGFMDDFVFSDQDEFEKERSPQICSRCKRPTKEALVPERLEKDAVLSMGDDERVIEDLVRLFEPTHANYASYRKRRLAEPHDIGYSSEGFSNDEENLFSPRVFAPRDTGLDTLSEAQKSEQGEVGPGCRPPPPTVNVYRVHSEVAPPFTIDRLKQKYGLANIPEASPGESSDVSVGIFKKDVTDSLTGDLTATDFEHTETESQDKTPPRHRKPLVGRESIQKLVLEVDELVALERKQDEATPARRVSRPSSREASGEYTSTEEASLGGEQQLASPSSDCDSEQGDFTFHRDPTLNTIAKSVTEMYEQSHRLDLSPFAIGELSETAEKTLTKAHYNSHTFPRTNAKQKAHASHTLPKIHATQHERCDGNEEPIQTEEFYISDQVWEYIDYEKRLLGDGDCNNHEVRSGFGASNEELPAVADTDAAVASSRRLSFADSSSSTPPPIYNFRPLAAPRRENDEDSDSDCEDLRHVLEESRAQLQVTDVTLGKIKRDMIERGNFLEPSKYKELLATCQTNIKCLQVIHQHLKCPNQTSIPDEDLRDVEEIIDRWEILRAVTTDKQSRCADLKGLHANLLSAIDFRDRVSSWIETDVVADDAARLEALVSDLQNLGRDIADRRLLLDETQSRLILFADTNPRYNVQKISDSVAAVDEELEGLANVLAQRLIDLKATFQQWLMFDEFVGETVFGLKIQRRRGQMLRRATLENRGSAKDAKDFNFESFELDRRLLERHAEFLEEDLRRLQELANELLPVASSAAREILLSQLRALCREVNELSAADWLNPSCDEGVEDTFEDKRWPFICESHDDDDDAEDDTDSRISSSFLSRIFRRRSTLALVSIAFLVLFIALNILFSPDCCHSRNNLRWSLQPQLRYSDGPPPQ